MRGEWGGEQEQENGSGDSRNKSTQNQSFW